MLIKKKEKYIVIDQLCKDILSFYSNNTKILYIILLSIQK